MATAPKAVQKAPAKGGAEAAEHPAVAPKKSGKKLILILMILLLAGGGGAAAWYFLGQPAAAPGTHAKKTIDPGKPPVFLVMDPFTVNLQPDGQGEQYLQVAFSLQVGDSKDVEAIKLYLPQVRSRLLLLLSGKKASEISTVEGKKKLADEILAQVRQPLIQDGAPQNAANVFFTSFVIQ
ncbi:flagellar basal body-associated protein FliL [Janthinobacterium sp. 17J80-10]|uniref:flagellar basal body-associated protein FliL n=1 Tax=Janthinobacterium sp. 17J80-10 TaxID=2497863 RepID=UPI0010054033|nr:flagellar basal body-associated protein FliL [Janthinobacterium sp. 17J80-10]QAU34360.1 flagellar basal body-associated protein FliL [Janthinobacterium sp. 17J80-10]